VVESQKMENSQALFTAHCLSSVTVTERHIHQMSTIFRKFPAAMEMYDEFASGLGSMAAARQAKGTPYQMYRDALIAWKSDKGAAATFSVIFRELESANWTDAKEAILRTPFEGLDHLQIKDKPMQSVRSERVGAVVDLMLDDPWLLRRWSQLADSLQTPTHKYEGEANRYKNGSGDIRELFKTILGSWVQSGSRSNPRTVGGLISHLKSMECNRIADMLEEMLGTETLIIAQ